MKPTVEDLDRGQLDLMWSFLQMGHQRANIPALEDLGRGVHVVEVREDQRQESLWEEMER